MLAIICVILIFLIIFSGYKGFVNKTRNKLIGEIPGNLDYPVIGAIFHFTGTLDQIWIKLRKLAVENYPIYKFWMLHYPCVNIICPEDVEIVLSSKKHLTKSVIYEALVPWLGTGLLTSTGSKWQNRRKILTPAFHFTILQQFFGTFVEQSENLVQRLEKECDKPNTDVVPIITKFTLYSICETAMGIRLDIESTLSRQYVSAVYRVGKSIVYVLTHPWCYYFPLFVFTPTFWKLKSVVNVLHKFTTSVIKKRIKDFQNPYVTMNKEVLATPKTRLAMLDLLISAKKSDQLIDEDGIREEVDTFMFEGHDTTTACIIFTLMLLACYSDVQETVVEELQQIFGDSDRKPTYHDLQNLRYLDQVLKECLRMYPSVPFISRVAEEDLKTHSGYVIPKDTVIILHIYDLHHNSSLYPDPYKFDPDRFLPENTISRHPFAYIPFSAGPRNCIGQKFAYLEIKTAILAILRKFKLEPVDYPNDVALITHLTLKSTDGVRVRFKKR